MRKGLTIFIAVITAVCLVSMISVSANDTGYGQFGRIYFGTATSDEATFDEASFDEASLDEASPDYVCLTSKKVIYYKDCAISEKISKKTAILNQSEKKANQAAENKVNVNISSKNSKKINKIEKITPQIQKTNVIKQTKSANTADAKQPNYIGWILLGVSIAGIATVLVVANIKRKKT